MRIFIEADSIAYEKMSGIGHATLEIIRQLDLTSSTRSPVTILIPFGTRRIVEGYGFKNIRIRSLPRGQRYLNYALTRTSLPVFMDLLYGKGVYIFPNYKNWPLLRSASITFVHDVVFEKFPDTVQPKNLAYLRANFNRWLGRTNRIVSISRSSANELVEYYPQYADKIDVVYLGVNPKEYSPRDKGEIDQVLKKYNLPKLYFLYVGNVEPRKNLAKLLDGYIEYCGAVTNSIPLVIVGGGGWKNEEIILRIEDLQAKGYRIYRPEEYVVDEDLPALYTGATSLVHVAIHEGFGLGPVQALYCSTPVIVSDIPVMRELLIGQGITFVNPTDSTQLAHAMQIAAHTKDAKPIELNASYEWALTVSSIKAIIDKL